MTKDEYYLGIARAVSQKSKCLKKQYGAVIVNNDEIVATGYNGCCRGEPDCQVCTKHAIDSDEAEYSLCPAVHAEQNAIISASRNEMLHSTLYLAGFMTSTNKEITAYPCNICLRLIKNAGIDRVVNSSGIIYQRNQEGILIKIG